QSRCGFPSATITPAVVASRTAKSPCHHFTCPRHISSSWCDEDPGAGQSTRCSAVTGPSCRAALGPAEGPGTDEQAGDRPGREDDRGAPVLPRARHLLRLPAVGE